MRTPADIRAELQAALDDRTRLRREMDAEVDANGGHMDRERAEEFQRRINDVDGRIWALKAALRTPAPAV